jgi:hypothetical protein
MAISLLSVFLLFFPTTPQVLPGGIDTTKPLDTAICALVADPYSFTGRIVKLKAEILMGSPESTSLASSCESGLTKQIAFEVPENVSDSPAATKDDMYDLLLTVMERFHTRIVLNTHETPQSLRHVLVTVVGRFDGPDKLVFRNAAGNIVTRRGYGNGGEFKCRLIVLSVESVSVLK